MDHMPLPVDIAEPGESIVLLRFEPPNKHAAWSEDASPERLCELAIRRCREVERPLLVVDLRGHAYINRHRIACLLLTHRKVLERRGRSVVLVGESDSHTALALKAARLDRILDVHVH
jgi:hypothetical protein